MEREVEPHHMPALSAGGVNVKDAERHGQALAAVDDPHQIGVLHVLIGEGIALIAVALGQHFRECGGTRGEIGGALGRGGSVISNLRQVIAVALERHTGTIERRQRERGSGQVDRAIILSGDGVEQGPRLVARAHGPHVRRGSSLSRTWLMTLVTPAMLRA